MAALVVGDAGLGAQGLQTVAAVFGDGHHAALVQRVSARIAIGQHRHAPAPHRGVEQGADDQRAVAHQHPLDGLERHARPGPGRRVAGRDFAGVGETGLERGAALALDEFDRMASARQVVGCTDTDHTTAEHQDFHAQSPCRAQDFIEMAGPGLARFPLDSPHDKCL